MKTYADIAARARALHEAGAMPTRQWTLPLICDHLAKAMTGSTGVLGPAPTPSKPAPLHLRIAGRILVLHLGIIPGGRPTPARIVPQPDVSWDDAIRRLEDAIALCQEKSRTERQWLVNPVIGISDPKSWERFHIVHARHHFGCLASPKPKGD